MLDEITYPMNWGWIATDDVVATIRDRPTRSTSSHRARRARRADRDRRHRHRDARTKHAYERGIRAKKGIDY